MNLTTLALASGALAAAFALSSTFALANTVRHRPRVRSYALYRSIPQAESDSLYPSYGASGGTMWNGRSASEWGGGAP
jgi:hypothetical protein